MNTTDRDLARVYAQGAAENAAAARAIADATPDSATANYFAAIADRAIKARDAWLRRCDEFTCAPEHRTGSKPYPVPVPGNQDREVKLYVVYHGDEYLNCAGEVAGQWEHMTYAQATAAIAAHEEEVRTMHPRG